MEKPTLKNTLITRGKIKDKRKVILNAALTLITSNGFHGTSIKMIAKEANIAAGTIYIHFSNKEEMIIELYEEISKEINEIIQSSKSKNISTRENFLNIWTAILAFYISDPRKPEFVTQYTYTPYITTNFSKLLLAPVQLFFEEAKTNKQIKDLPISALIALSHSPITSLVRMAKYDQIKLKNIEVNSYAEACWDAIKLN
jgi:AcrR family transcriptional regulator